MRALFPHWDLHGKPELPYFPYDVGETLAKACARVQPHFPEADFSGVGVWIVEQDTLARIFRDERAIFLHGILNHPQTPEEVIEFILCHELLHLVIPSREVDGHMTSHPPEFQAMEARVYPPGWHRVVMAAHHPGAPLEEKQEAEAPHRKARLETGFATRSTIF